MYNRDYVQYIRIKDKSKKFNNKNNSSIKSSKIYWKWIDLLKANRIINSFISIVLLVHVQSTYEVFSLFNNSMFNSNIYSQTLFSYFSSNSRFKLIVVFAEKWGWD